MKGLAVVISEAFSNIEYITLFEDTNQMKLAISNLTIKPYEKGSHFGNSETTAPPSKNISTGQNRSQKTP